MKKILRCILILFVNFSFCQTTVDLTPSQDNSIFSESNNSNGLGRLFSGQNSMGNNRRCLFQFDFSAIPSTAIVSSVTLTLNVNQVSSSTTDTFTLHRLTTPWGEGTSFSGGGSGSAAVAPDATWSDAMLGTSNWTTSGGDFITDATHSLSMDNTTGSKVFSSTSTLVEDVQNWIDGTNSNYGWILIGDESTSNTTRRFGSKDQDVAPVLSITYATLNIHEFEAKNVSIYPNPSTTGRYTVTSKNNMKDITVYDMHGKLLKTVITDQLSTHYELDITDFANGMYVLKVFDANGNSTAKNIIKY